MSWAVGPIFAGRGNVRVDPPVDLGNDTARERAEV
jgi:hypothetical protein